MNVKCNDPNPNKFSCLECYKRNGHIADVQTERLKFHFESEMELR